MKKNLLILSMFATLALGGCAVSSNSGTTATSGTNTSSVTGTSDATGTSTDGTSTTSESVGSAYDYNSEISVEDPTEIEVDDNTGTFSIESSDGTFAATSNGYLISAGGTYTLSGSLNGQILIEAGEEDEVILELNGVTITYGNDSPIKALTASKVEISAKKDTGNTIKDTRSAKVAENENLGEGAISAKVDLKLKGSGTLVVEGGYNNAVHSTKDVTIQKLSLKATGYNNAIKGKNSVTIVSGEVQAYAKTGNGIITEESDLTSKGKQKGTIAIQGGSVYVDSLHDALDAAYNVEIDQLDDTAPTSISLKTGTNATYYSRSSFTADSEKGIKAANEIIINKGTIVVAASDDAIHANYGDTLGNSSKGLGNITINDGLIQVASGDDGLHADNTLTISGGKVVVNNATEGFEGNYITINGGYSYIYGTDDGVNCSKKSFNNCVFTMNGGYLDVAVRSGDTDGIDSNGDLYIKGGTIVTRGSPGSQSGMSTGFDVDGTCSMTGGTLIAFNGLERSPSTSNGVLYAGTASQTSGFGFGGGGPGRPGQGGSSSSSYSFSAGNYVLSGNGLEVSFTNDYNYATFLVYSSSLVSGSSYTLSRGGTSLLSWTQSSSSVTIS